MRSDPITLRDVALFLKSIADQMKPLSVECLTVELSPHNTLAFRVVSFESEECYTALSEINLTEIMGDGGDSDALIQKEIIRPLRGTFANKIRQAGSEEVPAAIEFEHEINGIPCIVKADNFNEDPSVGIWFGPDDLWAERLDTGEEVELSNIIYFQLTQIAIAKQLQWEADQELNWLD